MDVTALRLIANVMRHTAALRAIDPPPTRLHRHPRFRRHIAFAAHAKGMQVAALAEVKIMRLLFSRATTITVHKSCHDATFIMAEIPAQSKNPRFLPPMPRIPSESPRHPNSQPGLGPRRFAKAHSKAALGSAGNLRAGSPSVPPYQRPTPPLNSPAWPEAIRDGKRTGSGGGEIHPHWRSCGHTKAQVVVPVVRRVPVAVGGAAVPGVVVPAAAPVHPVRGHGPPPKGIIADFRQLAPPKWPTKAHSAVARRWASSS